MKIHLALLAGAALLVGCDASDETDAPASEPQVLLNSGIDLEGMDRSIRPQDDFFGYANNGWLSKVEIPDDQSSWGSFNILNDNGLDQLQTIIEESAADVADSESGAKIGNYYKAWMDEEKIDALALAPLHAILAKVDSLESHHDVVAFLGTSSEFGIDAPFGLGISQDVKNPERYVVIAGQSGLGLPDRDYYFDESERGLEIRQKYQAYVETILGLANTADAKAAAERIIELETQLAELQWTRVANRDPEARYNKYTDAKLEELLSNPDLDTNFAGIGTGRQEYVIVRQPSYFEAFNDIFADVPVTTWREYMRLQVLGSFANFLNRDFVDVQFEYTGKTLRGQQEQTPRWKRAIGSINGNLGELLGQLYVEKHFPPEAKTRMETMVQHLILAYEESIQDLEWMSDETRVKALEKLSKFSPKIGYPNKWRDYSSLDVTNDDLVGNIMRARSFNHYRQIDKLGKPIDREEWFMSPQTVNAYYNPPMNQIVFPAAILQPPFFDLEAEDARNYGAIGMVIGHEIAHGFDDSGSQYDGDGNLKNWWTEEDRTRFEARTDVLVEQYNKLEALPGLFVNGELTLGENIGDLGGAAIALRAYEMSLGDEASPVIDGLTGNERFFLGAAQVWRSKSRDQTTELRVKSDPHSPPIFRVNGVMPNVDAFYETFNVREGDGHYLPPDMRVRIWR